MKTLYTAKATATAGRAGHAETDDKKLSLDLSVPGGNGPGTNPEQLFAVGYAACFGGAVEAAARIGKVTIGKVQVNSTVNLNQDEATGYSISAELNVTIDGVDKAQAEELVAKAHTICPYSKATKGNIEVILKVNNETLAKAA